MSTSVAVRAITNRENTTVDFMTAGLDAVLEQVYRESGHDFRDYRRGTVSRRLQRRFFATGSNSGQEYMAFLDGHPVEYQRLLEDLTIKVSGFFRSPYTYQQAARRLLPQIAREKRRHRKPSLKIWSVACARGEEPYSIAIMLAEFTSRWSAGWDSRIYATDISPTALAVAKTGSYHDVAGIPTPLQETYFHRQGEDYRVTSNIRRMVSFQRFDLLSQSPPTFTPVDCIFCCNTLIYMQKPLQARVLQMLYESLADPGYLVLGDAETPTDGLREKLTCLDAKAKIYKKQE